MAANTNPIFPLTPNIGFTALQTTGNNNYDGTNAAVALVYTAGTNGSFPQVVVIKAAGTNIQTVLRMWVNNGSTNGTATNNTFYKEWTLTGTTASANSSTQLFEFPLNFIMPAGYKLYVVLATTVAAGYAISVSGMDF